MLRVGGRRAGCRAIVLGLDAVVNWAEMKKGIYQSMARLEPVRDGKQTRHYRCHKTVGAWPTCGTQVISGQGRILLCNCVACRPQGIFDLVERAADFLPHSLGLSLNLVSAAMDLGDLRIDSLDSP